MKGTYQALCRSVALPIQNLVQLVAGQKSAKASCPGDLDVRLARHGLVYKARRSGLIVNDGRN